MTVTKGFSLRQKKSKIKSKSTKENLKKTQQNSNENAKEVISNDFHIVWIEASPVVRT